MDRIIQQYKAVEDDDLMLCIVDGVAYQRDMKTGRVSYGEDYLRKVEAYDGSAIALAVNRGRCEMMARHIKPQTWLLDFGAGSGAFVRDAKAAGFNANGFEVIPQAAAKLRDDALYADDPSGFDAVTMWDTIEHMEYPEDVLRQVRDGAYLFVSVPVFSDLHRIRESKHYRPGEHLYYFTTWGFVEWITCYGFAMLEQSWHEVDAGRENIAAFAFVRDVERKIVAA